MPHVQIGSNYVSKKFWIRAGFRSVSLSDFSPLGFWVFGYLTMYIKNINNNILTEYGRTLFFPSNFCSQSSNTGDSEYVSELFFLGNVLLKVLEFDTAKIKRKKFH